MGNMPLNESTGAAIAEHICNTYMVLCADSGALLVVTEGYTHIEERAHVHRSRRERAPAIKPGEEGLVKTLFCQETSSETRREWMDRIIREVSQVMATMPWPSCVIDAKGVASVTVMDDDDSDLAMAFRAMNESTVGTSEGELRCPEFVYAMACTARIRPGVVVISPDTDVLPAWYGVAEHLDSLVMYRRTNAANPEHALQRIDLKKMYADQGFLPGIYTAYMTLNSDFGSAVPAKTPIPLVKTYVGAAMLTFPPTNAVEFDRERMVLRVRLQQLIEVLKQVRVSTTTTKGETVEKAIVKKRPDAEIMQYCVNTLEYTAAVLGYYIASPLLRKTPKSQKEVCRHIETVDGETIISYLVEEE